MHVVLLGDSTIDNVCWTGHPHEVTEQLKSLLPEARITNYAADGFNSTDLLRGAAPRISAEKRREIGDPFPELSDDVFKPLDHVASMSPPPSHAVVSIGGNDVREILGRMDMLQSIIQGFHSNYMEILGKLCASVPNVILMFQYRPAFHMDRGGYGVYQAIGSIPGPGDSVDKINSLMLTCYAPVLAKARDMQLPIVDLPRSFDIYDDELFCCQIEPSAKGGAEIAKLLSHTLQNHDFSRASKFYFSRDGAVCEELNDGSVQWSIPRDPSAERHHDSVLQGRSVEIEP
ncbi:unnamed protein product [Prorocentrum cordatum]|uniref:SGNH hydrolase-type esterase domain-containing protein n=1 Tax=Prorocentrum cordatum TaxID=2364126 RepID=A0ABN9Y572_9DINO|nr:unnamed protein product [Polarella glacialis]